ncbi:MAG TPA: MarR family transcriptional regulator [Jatrophihabitans sp.]|nr:MarR family transcriptional regulator [Jatrophihabitans sp.]
MPTSAATASDELAIAGTLDRLLLWVRRKAPSQLSATSVTTLDTLSQDGPLRISDLAVREGVSQPGMTTLINRLAGEGLAERFADPTDGRASLVRITAAGREVLADRHRARTEAILTDVQRLSAEHRADLAAALDAMNRLCQLTGRDGTQTKSTGTSSTGASSEGTRSEGTTA